MVQPYVASNMKALARDTVLYVLKITIMIILSYIVFQRYKAIAIFGLLLLGAAVSRMYNHIFWIPQLGFELYSSATVLTGYLLGPLPGLFQGILSNFFAYLLSGKIKFYAVISMLAWGMIGFACGLLRDFNLDITKVGLFFVISYDIITTPIFISSGARVTSAAFHFVTHILFSVILFSSLVPFIYSILR
jgi:hypothetical protein